MPRHCLSALLACSALLVGASHGSAKLQSGASVVLKTDRPVYVVGAPIRLWFFVTNEAHEEIEHENAIPIILEIRDARGRLLPSVTHGRVVRPARILGDAIHTRLRLEPDQTDVISALTPENFGYRLSGPGVYRLTAKVTFDESDESDPTIRIVTASAARALPRDVLNDPETTATFRRFVSAFIGLRAQVAAAIARARQNKRRMGDATRSDTGKQILNLQSAIEGFDSFLNARSAYVQVTANFDRAAIALDAAGGDAFDCDPLAARRNLTVADYYLSAVQRELSSRTASAADASSPPPLVRGSGYCPAPPTPSPTPFCPYALQNFNCPTFRPPRA